ncbi:MAG: BON domain-containing protein [Planctomycetaceae bacterium]
MRSTKAFREPFLVLADDDSGELEIGPRNALRSHRRLHDPRVAAIRQALRCSGYLALRDVRVEWDGTTIVLQGRVSSFYLKQRAQETVREIAIDLPLRNELEVSPPPLALQSAHESPSHLPKAPA